MMLQQPDSGLEGGRSQSPEGLLNYVESVMFSTKSSKRGLSDCPCPESFDMGSSMPIASTLAIGVEVSKVKLP